MSPRELVESLVSAIEGLDFGYDSETSTKDIWKAALDAAIATSLITQEQRIRIENENNNQRILESRAEQIKQQQIWEALTPEQQERRRFMRESFKAQSKVIESLIYRDLMKLAFKMPGITDEQASNP